MNTGELKLELFRKSKTLGKLEAAVGDEGMAFLCHTVSALTRLLPHTETNMWSVRESSDSTRVKWADENRRAIVLNVKIRGPAFDLCLGNYPLKNGGDRRCGADQENFGFTRVRPLPTSCSPDLSDSSSGKTKVNRWRPCAQSAAYSMNKLWQHTFGNTIRLRSIWVWSGLRCGTLPSKATRTSRSPMACLFRETDERNQVR